MGLERLDKYHAERTLIQNGGHGKGGKRKKEGKTAKEKRRKKEGGTEIYEKISKSGGHSQLVYA